MTSPSPLAMRLTLILSIACASATCLAQEPQPATPPPQPPATTEPQPLNHRDRLELSFTAEQVATAKDGPLARFVLDITEDALVVIWAHSETLDTGLSIAIDAPGADDAVTVTDSSSGGGPHPCIEREAKTGERWTVSLLREDGEPQPASVTLAAWLSPWNEETRAAADCIDDFRKRIEDLVKEGAYEDARTAAADSVAALKEKRTEHLGLSFQRFNLGNSCWHAQAVNAAKAHQKRAMDVFERALPPDHENLARARGNLAVTIKALGELHGARALLERVLEVFERTMPPDHPNLVLTRLNLGNTLYALGDIHGARALQERVLEVRERTLHPDHPHLASVRGNLALTIKTLGDLHGARVLEERVLETRERTLHPDHPHLGLARLSLAATIKALGDLRGARALLERVLEVGKRTLPQDHPQMAIAQQNLANILADLGDLRGARALLERVLEVLERTLPPDHADIARARQNLAHTLADLGDTRGARGLMERALDVLERTLPPDHQDLALTRQSLADLLAILGETSSARALMEPALDVLERTLPPDHPNLQLARGTMATIMHYICDYRRAIEIQEQILEVQERTLPPDHPSPQVTRENLAWCLAKSAAPRPLRQRPGAGRGNPGNSKALSPNAPWEQAVRLVRESTVAAQGAVRSAVLDGSPREAAERIGQAATRPLGLALAFAAGCGIFARDDSHLTAAFALSESSRGASLTSAVLARASGISANRDRLRVALRQAAEELARLASTGATPEQFHAARSRREAAERDLLALAREQAGERAAILDVDLDFLSARLREREAIVGFRRTTRWRLEWIESDVDGRGGGFEGRSGNYLGAFVLARPGDGGEAPLRWIDLGPAEPIERAVEGWRAWAAAGRRMEPADAESDPVHRSGSRLRALVWDPLLEALGDAERVTVALDDVLHLVPLDALPLDGGGYLGDRVRIETRVALWELLDAPPPVAAGGALVALGGADFGPAPSRAAAPEDVAASGVVVPAPAGAGILRGGPRERGFEPLPQTGPEARGVAALAQQALGGDAHTVVLSGREAGKQALAEAAPKARWLHIATHGWYAPESIKSWNDVSERELPGASMLRAGMDEVVRGMNPMLLCGLALAGANLPADSLGRTPGLLTAEELSAFDLSNCELAVLSACDTNIGERRAGQGVASLQMALQMAGARTVVTSLWKVPDEATRDLMLDFYRRIWVEKKPKHQALREAKARLRAMKDSEGRPLYTTRDWAAWVLTGDPG